MERRNPTEAQLSSEFWGGHELQDGCKLEPLVFQNGYNPMADFIGQHVESHQSLKEFNVPMPEGPPIKEFTNGEVFRSHQYGVLTIIRFKLEGLRISGKKTEYISGTYWGSANFNPNDISEMFILGYEEIQHPRSNYIAGEPRTLLPASIVCGEVTHRRTDYMRRITSLELWKVGGHVGDGIPQRAPNSVWQKLFRKPLEQT